MNSFDLTHALHGIHVHKLNSLPRILAIKFYWSFPHHIFKTKGFCNVLVFATSGFGAGIFRCFVAWFALPTQHLPARLVTCTLTRDISTSKMGHMG